MAITAAQLVAVVSVQGDAEAKAKLQGMNESVKETSGGFKSMASGAFSFLGGMAAFALASSAVSFLKDQVSDLFRVTLAHQGVMADTVNTLQHMGSASGQSAQSVADFADKMSKLTMFSADATQKGENLMLTFGNIGKTVFPQATTAAMDMSQKLGQDLQSSVIQVGKALNDPIVGMTALQRVGVSFTAQEKEQIKTMTAHNNLMGAQKIVLFELTKQFGGDATTAGKTFAGQMAILGHQAEDLKIKIGTALLPILTNLLQKITPIVSGFLSWASSGHAVSDMIAYFNAHSQVLIPILAGLGAIIAVVLVPAVLSLAAGVIAATWPFLAIGAAVAGVVAIFMHFYQTNAGFKSFIDNLVVGLKQVAAFIQANFIPGIQLIWSVIQSKVLPALQQFGNWFSTQAAPILGKFAAVLKEVVIPAIQQLVASISTALTWIITHWTQIWGLLGPILQGVWNVISGVVKVAWALVSGIITIGLDILRGNWKAVWEDIKKLLGGVLDGIGTIVRGFVQIIGGLFSLLGTVVRGKFDEIKNNAVSTAQNLVNTVVSFFQSLPGRALGAVGSLAGMLSGFFGGLASSAFQWGVNIIQGIINGIGNMIGGVIQAAQNVASAIANFLPHTGTNQRGHDGWYAQSTGWSQPCACASVCRTCDGWWL
jgi:phage-related protein